MHKVKRKGSDGMKKKMIVLVGILLCISGIMFFVLKEDSFAKKIENLNEDLKSYKLEGVMEIVKGEDIKNYALEVGYKKENDEDLFKVSITDKELEQTQVILRNEEGVYVLTPTLNQIFKFEGDWPLNSLKPYLIQSMNEILKSDSCVVEKQKDGYLASSSVNYPNNANFKMQEMIFDENANIKELTIKDAQDITQLHIVFSKVKYNTKLNKTYFDLPSSLEAQVSGGVVLEEQMPLYPVSIYDSQLSSVKTLQVATGVKHVLEYEGDCSFTIIESIKKSTEETQTVIMNGEFIDSIDAFGFYDGNHMQLIKEGVEYTIYSEDLNVNEMMEILNSMQVAVMK